MRRGIAILVAALASVLVALVGVAPAQAAGSGISFSVDGTNYAPNLSAPLFGSALLVPNDTITRSFWVRNDASSAGYLRLTLRDVATTNIDFADVLNLRADLIGWPGESVPVQSARPCARLSEGPIIPAGSAAKVDVSAALGDLLGLHGQGGMANFTVVVSLSGEPLGLGRTGCPASGAQIGGFSDYDARDTVRAFHGATAFSSTASGWMPVTETHLNPTEVTTPTTATPTPPVRLVAHVNSTRFYQEWDVALWLVVLLLGGIGALLWGRRRSRTT